MSNLFGQSSSFDSLVKLSIREQVLPYYIYTSSAFLDTLSLTIVGRLDILNELIVSRIEERSGGRNIHGRCCQSERSEGSSKSDDDRG